MDVTPQELRGTEIKEAWRGFNRDEVDDLLERAASTIEHLMRQLQELESRVQGTAAAEPAPLPTNRDDAEMLQRTLMLAQRAADDAVNEAQAHARQLIEESEARAQSLVSEAESTARRIAESERRRLDDEIRDLAVRRDHLAEDADALETYASGYRERLRAAIEADLERLSTGSVDAPSPRPELHEVELPPERDRSADADRERASWDAARGSRASEAEPVAAATLSASTRPSDDEWPPSTENSTRNDVAASGATAASAATTASAATAPRADAPATAPPPPGDRPGDREPSWLSDEASAGTSSPEPPAPWDLATAEHQPFAADTPLEAHPVDTDDDDLDDDAFFASLREAVRDDVPLGALDERTAFFDEEPADSRRGFRRRR
jgi:cell division septum initiation protein DivIVA